MIYTLENQYVSLGFDSDNCSIISLKNRLSGDDYIKYNEACEIFELVSLKNNTVNKQYPKKVNRIHIENIEDAKILFVQMITESNICVNVEIHLQSKRDDFEFFINIENNSTNDEVVEVLYPRIRGVYLGKFYEDDIIIYPHHAGEKTLNPIKNYLDPKFVDLWRANTKRDEEVYYREINYCGLASMMWMYYYDDKNGFYISSHDKDFLVTGLRVEISSNDDKWIGFSIRKYLKISSKETWKSNSYVISVNCKDWHSGAGKYRNWINKYIKSPYNPDYLDEECVLMNMYHFKREDKVYYRFEDIPKLFDTARDYGIDHFFMASWNRKGFDTDYPEYYPDMELGTSMDLYNGCKYISDNGGIATFYINARIFDINSEYFNSLGKAMSIKKYDGNMIKEKYEEHRFVVECPSDKKWQKHIIDTAFWTSKCYEADGIYLDQLGSAEPYPCYDKNHSHDNNIGLFNKGYVYILETLYSQLRKINKNSFLMIENCGDIYGGYTWGNLTWNERDTDEFFNMFKYTFPEYCQINMINPKDIDDREYRKKRYYKDIERALVLGSVLWVNPITKFNNDDGELLDYLRKAITFRKKINSYIVEASFVDDCGITNITEGIKVTRWIKDDEVEIFIVGNRNETDGVFDIPYYEEEVFTMFNIDGDIEEVVGNIDNNTITISASKSKVSCIVKKMCGKIWG